MNKYPSPIIMTVFAFGCITIGILIAYFGLKYDMRSDSPPRVPVPVSPAGPGHIILSTMDLQRELNRRNHDVKLKVDGAYGALTQAAHERAIGDQYAKELR